MTGRLRPGLWGLVVLLLAGCSLLSSEKDNTEPPAPLTPIRHAVRLQRVWHADAGAAVREAAVRLQPALDGGRLFAAGRKGRVTAFDADTGKRIWRRDTGRLLSGGVGVGDGLVLVGDSEGTVIALDWRDGSEVWRAEVGNEVLAPPVVQSGHVVVQVVGNRVLSLDAADGHREWRFEREAPVLTLRGTSTPLAVSDAVIAGLAGGRLVALTLDAGRLVWEQAVGVPRGRTEIERIVDVDAPPVRFGNLLYAAAYQGRVVALEGRSGRILWARKLSSHAGLAVDDRRVYVTGADSRLWALDRRTGAALWKQDGLRHRRLTRPVPWKDWLVVGDFAGYLHLVARSDGALRGRVKVSGGGIGAAPLAAGDRLYVQDRTGGISAYRIATGG